MGKITTISQFYCAFTLATQSAALRAELLTEDNLWMVREHARTVSGQYVPIRFEGDDPLRFLHASIDDPTKVAYTKDAEHGRADVQTRTTIPRYCAKFGLNPCMLVDQGMFDER